MDWGALSANLLSPAVLLFLVGLLAALMRSDLDLPAPLPKALGLFLLLAIGFKGGVALRETPGEAVGTVVLTLAAAAATSLLLPIGVYAILRKIVPRVDAAALAAAYGSVSAVTFVTAVSFLDTIEVPYGGHMVAAMALMESPAIVAGVFLGRRGGGVPWGKLMHEAVLGGPIVLLGGALLAGFVANPAAAGRVLPSMKDAFDVVLLVFLLDMGLVAGRQLTDVRRELGRRAGTLLVAGLVLPPVQAMLGIGLAYVLRLPAGEALLMAVLVGSASYIAVPAAVRLAMPEARPGLFVTLPLGVTFPFNIAVGIPLYWLVIGWLW
jgi:hypothetical protein